LGSMGRGGEWERGKGGNLTINRLGLRDGRIG
jgi:hypothetical protein